MDEIREVIGDHESEEREWKLKPDTATIARELCAFLNGRGGTIIIGVDSRGEIIGVEDADGVAKHLRKALLDAVHPLGSWSVSTLASGNQRIIVIDVSGGGEKPYVVDGTIWTRKGEQTRRAGPADVSAIISERSKLDERWERRLALDASLRDLDQDELFKIAAVIEKSGRQRLRDVGNAESILDDLSLSRNGQLTNAALILFGRKPAEMFPQAAVRVTVYPTDKRGDRYTADDRIALHLFGAIRRLQEFVERYVGTQSDFVRDSMARKDRPEYPFAALREGFVNALVHRDLGKESGGMTVGIYRDRIEIWNTGGLPDGLKPSDLKKDHPSLPRNPDIAHVCFLGGLMERLGRGTQFIATSCSQLGLKTPKWESSATGTKLVLFGRTGTSVSLNLRQQQLLKRLRPGDSITVHAYLQGLTSERVSDRTARTDLAALERAGLLHRRSSARSTHYVRTEVQS